MRYFPSVQLGGAILCSGVLLPPPRVKGYGPENKLTSYQLFQYIINVNLLGTYNVAQKVSELLLSNEPTDEDGTYTHAMNACV
jgi:3-hydroxyacyl-CoA dehydrogenase/3-hydroxy-2-methylbutyryl-CoA dehydrogenase